LSARTAASSSPLSNHTPSQSTQTSRLKSPTGRLSICRPHRGQARSERPPAYLMIMRSISRLPDIFVISPLSNHDPYHFGHVSSWNRPVGPWTDSRIASFPSRGHRSASATTIDGTSRWISLPVESSSNSRTSHRSSVGYLFLTGDRRRPCIEPKSWRFWCAPTGEKRVPAPRIARARLGFSWDSMSENRLIPDALPSSTSEATPSAGFALLCSRRPVPRSGPRCSQRLSPRYCRIPPSRACR
jgi:hypothetical protein